MARLTHKLKAGTLIESLIAMVIILICMGIATIIYANVLNSDKHRQELKAMLILNEELAETKKERTFLNQEKEMGEWRLKKSVQFYEQTENVFKLSLSVVDIAGEKIAELNELILANP